MIINFSNRKKCLTENFILFSKNTCHPVDNDQWNGRISLMILWNTS